MEHRHGISVAARPSDHTPVPPKGWDGNTTVYHPLVIRHPVTGKKTLYAVTGTSQGIKGMGQAEAEKRDISFSRVWFSCDAAYQRSNALMKTVVDAGLTLLTKVSGNITFSLLGQTKKAKVIRDETPRAQMKQSGRLSWQYRYKRLIATHPVLGKVVLIVSVLYDEKHDKYRRTVLMTTDLTMQATTAIKGYKLRWRIEISHSIELSGKL